MEYVENVWMNMFPFICEEIQFSIRRHTHAQMEHTFAHTESLATPLSFHRASFKAHCKKLCVLEMVN